MGEASHRVEATEKGRRPAEARRDVGQQLADKMDEANPDRGGSAWVAGYKSPACSHYSSCFSSLPFHPSHIPLNSLLEYAKEAMPRKYASIPFCHCYILDVSSHPSLLISTNLFCESVQAYHIPYHTTSFHIHIIFSIEISHYGHFRP
jgi:hypothetical protein